MIWGTKKTAEDGHPRISKSNTLYADELNLKDGHQLRMGKALLNYFKGTYGLLPHDREQCEVLSYEEARRKRNRKTAERKRIRNQLRRETANEQ